MNEIPALSSASFTATNSVGSFPLQMETILPSSSGAVVSEASASTSGTPQSAHCVTPALYSHLQLGQIIGSELYMKSLFMSQVCRTKIGGLPKVCEKTCDPSFRGAKRLGISLALC